MADENVLKSFLVKVGFSHDEAALTKIEKGIGSATKVVVGFAAAVEAAADAVFYGVARFANSLENLYFASIRTGTTAANLKALDRASMSFGTAAGEALASADALARFFRNNPGGATWLNAMLGQVGESAFDSKGQVRSIEELELALGKLFARNTRGGQGFLNTQIADMIGMSEKQMLAIQSPDYARKLAEEKAYMQSSGLNDAADGAHRFNESLRRLDDQLYVFGVRVVDVLEKKLGFSLDKVTQWFVSNGPWLANEVVRLVGAWIDEFNRFLQWVTTNWPRIKAHIIQTLFEINWAWQMHVKPALEWMITKFEQMDQKTGGWSTTLIGLLLVLKELGATPIIAGILGLGRAITGLGTAGAAIGTGGVLGFLGLAGVAAGVMGVGEWLRQKLGIPSEAEMVSGAWNVISNPGQTIENVEKWWAGFRNPAVKYSNMLQAQGLSKSQADGLTSNILTESSGDKDAMNTVVDPKTGKKKYFMGLFQLGLGEQQEYYKQMGRRIDGPFGMDSAENQIAFMMKRMKQIPGLMEGLQAHQGDGAYNAAWNAEFFNHMYEKPGNYAVEDPKRAGRAITINQHTDVTIHAPNKDVAESAVDRFRRQLNTDAMTAIRQAAGATQ
jgi:hypothetical protein